MILITGGSGYLGEALIERLLPKDIRVVSRSESKLLKLKDKFPSIEIVTGDIADEWTVKKVMMDVDEVYHLAAFKHVSLAEENSMQCINSNVIGSLNILKESFITKPKFVIGISTDKAAMVSGVYGATKFLMEALFKEAEDINKDTDYRVVRFGNILYSTGSVLCRWLDKIRNKEVISITDPEATRFFWTANEAVDLIFNCLDNSTSSTPMSGKMKAMKIGDLLKATMFKYGKTETKVIGLQVGENLHETMDGKTFSNEVEQFTIQEIKLKI